jgi:streptogramin lyase
MIIKPIFFIVLTSSLFAFVFLLLNSQSLYNNYVYAFPPSNAPTTDKTINGTITITTTNNQQLNFTDNKDSINKLLDNEILSQNIIEYRFIRSMLQENIVSDDSYSSYYYGIDIDSLGNVYVTDDYSILKFDSNGNFITKWGSEGSEDGQFSYPNGIAIDSQDNVYVTDLDNHNIQKFDSNGNFITKWGNNGTGDGQFLEPENIAVDSSDNVYVADIWNHNIQKFDSNGNFITKWGSKGKEDGKFEYPRGIGIDSLDNVYVADTNNHRLQKFDSNGKFITKWGFYGFERGNFYNPQGIDIDSLDNVFVSDYNNNRIQKFDKDGRFITEWGGEDPTRATQLDHPQDIAIDTEGYVYVSNSNGLILVFAPSK